MPWKAWSVGEEMLAAEFQQYIGNQVVAQFVDAAQRSTQLPSPQVGQLCTLQDKPGAVWIWNGSAWTEVSPYVQYGHNYFTANGAGGCILNFPVAFAAPPACIQLTNTSSNAGEIFNLGVIYEQITATSVGFVVRRATNGAIWDGGLRAAWTAWGVRA